MWKCILVYGVCEELLLLCITVHTRKCNDSRGTIQKLPFGSASPHCWDVFKQGEGNFSTENFTSGLAAAPLTESL